MRGGITACVIARDEAGLLDECLASVRGAVDEVLVVDHGSRDDTAAVALRAGARVIGSAERHHEIARNAYLEAVTTPWVLVIDADERLGERGRARLASHTRSAPHDVLGFALARHDYTGDGRWAEARLVRLFRSQPQIRYFASRAHASVVPAIDALGGRIDGAEDVTLHHLDALLPRDHHAKREFMRDRLQAEIATGGLPVMRCFLALELFALGHAEEASREILLAMLQNVACSPIARTFLAQQERARGRWEEAADQATRALAEDPRFRGRISAWVTLADARDRLGDARGADEALRQALAESPGSVALRVDLAALLDARGARDEARALLADALADEPCCRSSLVQGPALGPAIFRQQDALLSRITSVAALAERLA